MNLVLTTTDYTERESWSETFETKEEFYDYIMSVEADCEGIEDEIWNGGNYTNVDRQYTLTKGEIYSEEVLVRFTADLYYANLSGLFICTRKKLDNLKGRTVDFGEMCGKHSEVFLEDIEEYLEDMKASEQNIKDLRRLFKNDTISGVNVLDHCDFED
jgi:hypothetical protein